MHGASRYYRYVWDVSFMFVIIYLLEDEQELSLGMLIRPKCIYNFACSMHVLCDFAMFHMNFDTLLIIFGLTYLLNAPQCQFLFSVFLYFRFSHYLKCQKNS